MQQPIFRTVRRAHGGETLADTRTCLKNVVVERLLAKHRRAAAAPKLFADARRVCYVGAIGESLRFEPKGHIDQAFGRWRSWTSHLVHDLSVCQCEPCEDGVANQVLMIDSLDPPP